MFKNGKAFIFCGILATSLAALPVHAVDTLLWAGGKNPSSPKELYKVNMIKEALEKTVPEYGEYRFESTALGGISNIRAREMLLTGDEINSYIALTSQEWEDMTIPIRIPIRRGMVAYRLLLVHKNDVHKFKDVNSYEDLQRLTVGLQVGWTTTKVLQAAKFNVERSTKFEGLFHMLDGGRFDYLPRGINEVHNEVKQRENELEIAVEPRLAMYIPAPTYIFISPKEKRLAERIEAGLEMMIADGTMDVMFRERFAGAIKNAELDKRQVIRVPNPLLPKATPFDREELWYDVNEPL